MFHIIKHNIVNTFRATAEIHIFSRTIKSGEKMIRDIRLKKNSNCVKFCIILTLVSISN